MSATVKATVAWIFAAFLALAFRVLDRLAPIGLEEMPFVYLAFSIALLVVAFRIAIRWAPEERS